MDLAYNDLLSLHSLETLLEKMRGTFVAMTRQINLAEPLRQYISEILQSLPEAATIMDSSGEFVFANQKAAEICGYESVAALLAKPAIETLARFEVMDDEGRVLSPDELPSRQAVRHGVESVSSSVRYRTLPTGEERWMRLHVSRLQTDDDSGFLVVNVFHDTTEEVRAAQARSFINDAGILLGSSIDYLTTLRSLARLAVPRIADWCSVEMCQSDGSVRTLEVAHVNPKHVQLAWELSRKYPFNPDAEGGMAEALRTGEPGMIAEITDEMVVAGAPDPEFLQIIRSLGLQSIMWVPLKGRRGILGGITLVSAESGHRFNSNDLTFAQDLARRAALAVDNAQLYREAQRATAEFRNVLGQMADAVMVADTEGIVTFANESAHRLFGHIGIGATVTDSRREATLLTLAGDPLPMEDMALARAVAGETLSGFMWRVQLPRSPERVLQTSAVPLLDIDGTQLGAVTVSRDVTDQFDFDRQKDAFLLSASHDLKNPLTLVKGIAQLLEQRAVKRGYGDEQLFEGLQRISATASRMSEMVNGLLDVSRLEMARPLALEPSLVDLAQLVERVAEEVRFSSDRNTVEVHVEDRPRGCWDALRVERVLFNLLLNAAKFSRPDTAIHLRVWSETSSEMTWACVSVTDEGVGIPAADLPLVFDPFHRGQNVTDKIDGGGIGLTGVKQIVEQHGGSVTAKSQESKGSQFTVKLPAQEQHRADNVSESEE